MDPKRLDDPSDTALSEEQGQRPFRNTKARQVSEERRQADLLEEIEEKGDLSGSQRKKLDKLRKELRDDASNTVDPQSKPRYAGSTGENEDGKVQKPSQEPGSDHLSASVGKSTVPKDNKWKDQAAKTAPDASSAMGEGCVAEAYCRSKSFGGIRLINRYGPHGQSRYEFGPSKRPSKRPSEPHEIEEIKGLRLISSKDRTILDIQKGGQWQYSFHNIEKVVNIATLNPSRKWKPRGKKATRVFPTVLLKIQWCGIEKEHEEEFLQQGQGWIFRGKVTKRIKRNQKVLLDEWGRAKAKEQDLSYQGWLKKNGIANKDSEELHTTFYPDTDWANSPIRSKKNRSNSAQNNSNSTYPVSGSEKIESLGDGHKSTEKPRNKRRRSESEEETTDRIKKPRSDPTPSEKSAEKYIHWNEYVSDLKTHYKLTEQMCEENPKAYMETLDSIIQGWDDYRQNMLNQGYKVRPGGERPES
ncbi:uncharacterized protein N7446_003987 [Penicillium canescens]|uniref:Uncharacterized protein n=1 Tax=Penicillium canescens TaxID=5083 RepID=A0AAD6N3J8_PENCN|nr:uncharacterized protein N7446_003987 [Penicillium canescens]KAJ6027419.1 hypothetical protein N7460_012236 [Penicillium canescens]KAJ6040698.1 hypothetical protein N7444_009603 [Penicillium canescens]KAJ6066950.1 hypothetical protein N7446_003987 [Penicillium canescens]